MECPNDLPLFDVTSNATKEFFVTMMSFQKFYAPIHGFVCVALCVFGILTNLVHVAVLSRPAMRNSAVNCILTAVAVCDIGTMASYLIYIVHFVIMRGKCSPTFTHGWLQFLLWHVVSSITLHTTSLWLAVAMAFIRRMTLRVARLNSSWQRPQFAWKLCLGIYAIVFLLCVPNIFVHDIAKYENYEWEPPKNCQAYYPANYTMQLYTFQISPTATANNCRLFKLNIWMIGIVFKVIPCFLLFLLSIGLVMKIRDAERHRRKLTNASSNASDNNSNSSRKKSFKPDRTTSMLVVILVVFLITELPQGIISILCAIFTTDVHRYLYFYIGDILDLLSLLNSSVNFVLYCVMSSRYRQTFWTVVLPVKAYGLWMKRATTPSNFNFSTLPLQRKTSKTSTKSNKIRNKEYEPLATEAEEMRDRCMSPPSQDESTERVANL